MGILHNGIDLTTSVENEWLCLKICAHLGLPVANAEIATFGDQKCLVVERFDRKWTSRKVLRVPQEDLCQALGFPSSKKYQFEGGPGLVRIMTLLNASDERKKDRANFMRSQLIFFLLAATDGHAKNFSLFLTKNGFRLTPFYDVMSAFPAATKRQIQIQKATLAMSVAKRYKLKEIVRRHYVAAAKEAGFSQRELNEIIDELKESVPTLADQIDMPKGFPDEIFTQVFGGLEKQLRRL